MTPNNGNGYPAKLEIKLGEETKLKIMRPVKIGSNGKSPYYLYRVIDLGTGEEKSFFADSSIHGVIQDQKLGPGSEFVLKRVKNGQNGGSLELSILAKTQEPQTDQFKEVMRQSILDAIAIKKSIGEIDLTHEDLRSLSSCLFIARTRQ